MTPYAAEWTRRHGVSVTSTLCNQCTAPVQVRQCRRTGDTMILDPYPTSDGEWSISADGTVYRPEWPVMAYVVHRCEGDE